MCGQHVPDSQCGYRLIKVDGLKKMELTSERYDIESEMLVEASRNGLKIMSVPVRTIYGEETSRIEPVRDTIKFFNFVLRFYL